MRATVRAVKTSEPNRVSGEFVALVALTTSLVAMSIDTMLPALGTMATELGATEANDRQAILTTFFLGLSIGQLAALNLGWFAMRQAETLPPEQRVRFSARTILAGCKETFGNRLTLGYTLGSGFVFGAFIAYLSTSQQVFQEQYALGDKFPLLFGLLASGIGLASLLNGTLVVRFGIRRLSRMALVADCLLGAAGVLGSWLSDGRLPLELLIALLFGCFFCNGVLFGNFGARAMQPMGHIAGVAAAATNSASGLIALALGSAFGRAYDGTALPLVAGFTISGLLSLAITEWAERCPGASSVAASEGA